MKTQAHTPTPWNVVLVNEVHYSIEAMRASNHNVKIADIIPVPTEGYANANAAYIVRAVNSYDSYKRIVDMLKEWAKEGRMPSYGCLMPDSDTETIGEAIAQAEGK